jgi:hypothetical protein
MATVPSRDSEGAVPQSANFKSRRGCSGDGTGTLKVEKAPRCASRRDRGLSRAQGILCTRQERGRGLLSGQRIQILPSLAGEKATLGGYRQDRRSGAGFRNDRKRGAYQTSAGLFEGGRQWSVRDGLAQGCGKVPYPAWAKVKLQSFML